MKDPAEAFRFSFPDMQGQIVSHTDPRFRGKVVLVNISGSWCPNCHDEAPFLAALYKKYRASGLEIVTLSFEEGDQLGTLARLKAFNATYGIEHTVLVPGEPDELNDKVPQAENLNAFPTTFILGRDGRVRAVHAGFPSPGSGAFYAQAEHEVTTLVERLLAEKESRR
jgi:thiol-disulfide isomerase/thioredoxin